MHLFFLFQLRLASAENDVTSTVSSSSPVLEILDLKEEKRRDLSPKEEKVLLPSLLFSERADDFSKVRQRS